MQLKTMMLTLVTIGALTAVADPRVYYVDANRGNDAWTGTADWEHRDETTDPVTGPRKTLARLDSSFAGTASATNILHLEAGLYNEGVYTNNHHSADHYYRAYIPAYTRVVGTNATAIICGASATTPDKTDKGCGADAVRCVYVGGAGVVFDGVVLTGGRTFIGGTSGDALWQGSSGVFSGTDPTLVDCVVTNNVANQRGGVAYYCLVAAYRCYFADNSAVSALGNCCIGGGSFYNCVFKGADACYQTGAAYNCTFLENGFRGTTYNCLYFGATGRGENCYNGVYVRTSAGSPQYHGGKQVTLADIPYDPVTYRPLAGSQAIDFGSNELYTAAGDYRDLDFAHGPRVLNGRIDVGAGEYCWYPLAETSGLTTTVDGQTITIRRNYTSDRLVTGFTFNENVVAFDDYPEGQVFKYAFEGEIGDQTLFIAYAEKTEWYVNPVTGNDTNKGYGPYCAFKTLAALPQTDGTAANTNVFHLAAGEYREGTVSKPLYSGSKFSGDFRFYVPAYTRVVCDGPKGSAIIVGQSSTAADADAYGNGEGAVRCVYAKDNTASLFGCTLTGGRTGITFASTDASVLRHCQGSGAIIGGLCLVDCVLTNNIAYGEGGVGTMQEINAYRCFFDDNHGINGFGAVANYRGTFFNCVFGATFLNDSEILCYNNQYGSVAAYNCLFLGARHRATAYNCIYLGDEPLTTGTLAGDHNLFTDRPSRYTGTGFGTQIKAADVPYDADCRPLKTSVAVDVGDRARYETAFASSPLAGLVGVDYAGGQRVYNGVIDIGPGEYDWRGDFAPILNRKCVTIDAMSAGVTTNETVSSVVLSGGDALTIRITSKADGLCSLRALAASGEVMVVANGAAVAPSVGGVFEFNGVAGENAVTVSYVGEATCAVDSVKAAGLGLLLLLR